MNTPDPVFYYLILPTVLFIGIILFWLFQSLLLLFLSRRFIFPILYSNKITEWFVAQVGIAIHELSHLFAAIFTGSQIDLKESFLTSRAGRVSARTSYSIGGWISTFIAAFAPAFFPGLVIFIISVFFLNIEVPFKQIINTNPLSIDIGLFLNSIYSIIIPIISGLLSIFFKPSIIGVILLYFIMISSLTASPSEDDWKASASVLFSFPLIPLFVLFLFLNFVAIQFNFNLSLFLVILISIIFTYVLFGVLLILVLILIIKAIYLILKLYHKKMGR